MNSHTKPLILTTGEPAGIGPDLCIQLAEYIQTQPVVLCGDIHLLRSRAKHHNKNIAFHDYYESQADDSIPVHHIPCRDSVEHGILNVNNAEYVLDMLSSAAEHTINGDYAGIVTAPIHKGIICESGIDFSGHTEFFAEKTQTPLPVMVLGNKDLKVGLVTTHLPLAKVSNAITAAHLTDVLYVIHEDMKRYFTAGKPPRIGVCGLNPHAGEGGHMGHEEIEIINPTLLTLRQSGLNVSDALSADTLLVPRHAAQYDIIVAMYHDQGLPVIKAQGFGECVNITLGLPIIRTSVDHGTALDLAGTTKADSNSLRCAITMAQSMCQSA